MKKTAALFTLLWLASTQLYAQMSFDSSAYLKNNPNIYSIIISQNEQIVYKKYFNQHDEHSLFNDQSLTKGIVSLLVGIAIDRGYIGSVDEKISIIFPELKNDPDKRKQDITIRQIMNQASGLYHENLDEIGAFLSLPDQSGYVLKAPLADEPGKTFHYNNAASHLLSVILTRTTGMDTRSFAKKFLFDPMGIVDFDWKKMNDGYYDGCGLLSIRLGSADMARIGSLFLNEGQYQHRQVVPSAWIHSILNPDIHYPTDWGFDGSEYALCYYHMDFKGTKITYAMGWGGQFLIIIPSQKVIVVINENTADETAVRQSIIFMHRIFPLIFGQLK